MQAECKLERYLLENPPNECNTEAAGKELFDVQKELNEVLAANPKVDQEYMLLLLIHYYLLFFPFCLLAVSFTIHLPPPLITCMALSFFSISHSNPTYFIFIRELSSLKAPVMNH